MERVCPFSLDSAGGYHCPVGLAPPRPLQPGGRGAAAGVYHTPEGSRPGGLLGPGAWVLHMPAVGLVVDDRGRMKQSVLGYPWEAASRCSSLIEATSFHSLPARPVDWAWVSLFKLLLRRSTEYACSPWIFSSLCRRCRGQARRGCGRGRAEGGRGWCGRGA